MTERLRMYGAITIGGEGLRSMSQERFAGFVASLVRMGMTVEAAIPSAASEVVSDREDFERYVNQMQLASREDLRKFAIGANYLPGMCTAAWHALWDMGKYFPLTPLALTRAVYETEHTIFYYLPGLITPALEARALATQIDLERGFTGDDVSRTAPENKVFVEVRRRSLIDVHSVYDVVRSGVLADQQHIGPHTVQFVGNFCEARLGMDK